MVTKSEISKQFRQLRSELDERTRSAERQARFARRVLLICRLVFVVTLLNLAWTLWRIISG